MSAGVKMKSSIFLDIRSFVCCHKTVLVFQMSGTLLLLLLQSYMEPADPIMNNITLI